MTTYEDGIKQQKSYFDSKNMMTGKVERTFMITEDQVGNTEAYSFDGKAKPTKLGDLTKSSLAKRRQDKKAKTRSN